VSELERRPDLWRQIREEGIEQREILLCRGGQLKQQGAQFRFERAGRPANASYELTAVLEPAVVRDAARRFQRQLER
jgi:hypothetical protein